MEEFHSANRQNYTFQDKDAYLDRVFTHDPERQLPRPTVFVPIWIGAGKLHAVMKVDERNIPECFVHGEVPTGEMVEPFEVNRGVFHPSDRSFLDKQIKRARYEAQQRRRNKRLGRRS